jgi:hypothetical protein
MKLSIVNVNEDGGSVLFLLAGFGVSFVLVSHFPILCVFAPLDVESCDAVRLVSYGFPTRAVTFVTPALMIAIEVAHFVEQAVAILLFGAVIVEGNLDADTSNAPVKLAELAKGIVELDGDFGEFAFENGVVELVKPILHLRDCRLHISLFLGLHIHICKSRAKPGWN